MKRSLSVILFLISCTLVFGIPSFAVEAKPAQPAFQTAKQPDIQAIRPKRPAKVKLHRNAKGEYTWDITGDSADDVVRADARLRKLLKIE